MPHEAIDANVLEGFHVLDMPLIGLRSPGCISGEIVDLDDDLALPRERGCESLEVQPLEFRAAKIVYGVVKIEAVDVGNGSLHSVSISK